MKNNQYYEWWRRYHILNVGMLTIHIYKVEINMFIADFISEYSKCLYLQKVEKCTLMVPIWVLASQEI